MFDIGASELLLIAVVAILVIGPKDMPLALRTAGRWIGKVRSISNHFRSGLDSMIREAEMEDLEKKWQKQNDEIMKRHPEAEMHAGNAASVDAPSVDETKDSPPAAGAEARKPDPKPLPKTAGEAKPAPAGEPQLPLGNPADKD